jgi:hypothetical protein
MPTPSSSSSSQLNSNARSKGGSFGQRATRAAPPAFKGAKRNGKGSAGPRGTVFEGPLHDRDHIVMQYGREYSGVTPLKDKHAENPKSAVSNWQHNIYGTPPQYQFADGLMNSQKIYRYVLCCLLKILRPTFVQMYCDFADDTRHSSSW